MSFNSRETSRADGKPQRFYRFNRGVMNWLYTSADRNQAIDTQVFVSPRGGITDKGLRQSGVARQDSFIITAPADIDVAQPWRNGRPSAEVYLRVFDRHEGDAELVHRFTGTISAVKWSRLDTCEITCADIEASMQRPGLTDTFSRTCTTTLYSPWCGVDRNAYRVAASIQSISGRSLSSGTFASYPDGYLAGGYIEWSIGQGEYDTLHIETHTGSTITMLGAPSALRVGQALRVYPGCDFLASTCHSKYNNLPNLRAVPHLDGVSPFSGDQVF